VKEKCTVKVVYGSDPKAKVSLFIAISVKGNGFHSQSQEKKKKKKNAIKDHDLIVFMI